MTFEEFLDMLSSLRFKPLFHLMLVDFFSLLHQWPNLLSHLLPWLSTISDDTTMKSKPIKIFETENFSICRGSQRFCIQICLLDSVATFFSNLFVGQCCNSPNCSGRVGLQDIWLGWRPTSWGERHQVDSIININMHQVDIIIKINLHPIIGGWWMLSRVRMRQLTRVSEKRSDRRLSETSSSEEMMVMIMSLEKSEWSSRKIFLSVSFQGDGPQSNWSNFPSRVQANGGEVRFFLSIAETVWLEPVNY